ncbi:MAG: hypothetical protein E6K47_15200 [Gammaproteobacteria bacterium]|nr:MAG: hypothetical protein E6K47_15200 [Gammaproteobacteria bacterium]
MARQAAENSSGCVAFVPAFVIHGDDDCTVHPRNAEQIVEQLRAFAQHVGRSSGPLTEAPELRLSSTDRTYRQRDYLHRKRILLRKIDVPSRLMRPGSAAPTCANAARARTMLIL